jgi:hypothetical protein
VLRYLLASVVEENIIDLLDVEVDVVMMVVVQTFVLPTSSLLISSLPN